MVTAKDLLELIPVGGRGRGRKREEEETKEEEEQREGKRGKKFRRRMNRKGWKREKDDQEEEWEQTSAAGFRTEVLRFLWL